VIAKDGTVTQLVPFNRRAWHAGVSSWNGESVGNSVNSFAIGIENVGTGDSWPDAQVEAISLVTQALVLAYDLDDVVGHSDVAPGRKVDPGPNFPWSKVWSKHEG
jgi:N-acetyl-anhydromuramoyl-L-alanine amidase